MITLEEFKAIPGGEIFRIVTTKYHSCDRINGQWPMLTFVCIKGQLVDDWCIVYHWPEKTVQWIAEYGDKVKSEANILNIFPCTPEVLKLYRY